LEGTTDSTRLFLKVFLFCAFASAAGTAILAGVVPGNWAMASGFGLLAVAVLKEILDLHRSHSR